MCENDPRPFEVHLFADVSAYLAAIREARESHRPDAKES